MPNRRQFLSSATKTAGLLSLGASFPAILSASCSPKDKLGVALVGLGNYSKVILSPALQQTQKAFLAGVVTGTPSKAEEWAQTYNIPEANLYDYDSMDDIANNDDIDILYIVLPNSMHAPYTIRALETGKHVICEKPMALNEEEARQMIATADRVGRHLSIGYRLHFDPWHQEVMRIGREKSLGEVSLIESTLAYRYALPPDSWKMQKAMGGGPFYNLATYPVQAARYIKHAEPVSVTAKAYTQNPDYFEVDETVSWEFEFADGSIARSMASAAGYIDRMYGACTNGWFELQPCFNYTGQAGRTSEGPMEFTPVPTAALQIDDFVRCIQEGIESAVSGRYGLGDVLAMDAILQAVTSGERVQIRG